jgi:hypothetical protein
MYDLYMTNSNVNKYRKGISDKDTGIQYKLSTTETPLLTQQIVSQWPVASQILHKSEFSMFKFKCINTR